MAIFFNALKIVRNLIGQDVPVRQNGADIPTLLYDIRELTAFKMIQKENKFED
jgi:hypothetical protein